MDMSNRYGDSADMGTTGAWSGSTTGTGDQGVVEQAQEKAGQVVEQVQEKASQVAGQVRQQATTQLDSTREQAGNTLEAITSAIRQTGRQLREQDQGAIAQYTDVAADQVERFYGYLGSRNVNQIVGDVERFARREPALFLGAAFAVGLLAARFLKSSGQQAQNQNTGYTSGTRDQEYGRGYGGYTGRSGADYGSQGYNSAGSRGAGYGSQGYGAGGQGGDGVAGSDAGITAGGYGVGLGSGAVVSGGADYSAGYGAGTTGAGYGAGTTGGDYGTSGVGEPDYASDIATAGTGYSSQVYGLGDPTDDLTSAAGTGRNSDATG